jgi:hypothetical protein
MPSSVSRSVGISLCRGGVLVLLDVMLASERRFAALEEKNISSTRPVMLASGSHKREGTDGLKRSSDSCMLSQEATSSRDSS